MNWQHLNYVPLSPGPFALLLVALAALASLIYSGWLPDAYRRLGVSVGIAVWLLLASLLGSYINIPLAHFPDEAVLVHRDVDNLGIPFVMPAVIDWPGTIIAINIGGAVIPVILSLYLLARHRLWLAGAVATSCVAIICYTVAFPVEGMGIAIPALAPPVATGIIAVMISWRDAPALAYISGSLGVLIGADLLNIRTIGNMGAPVASIGGAGTFDGIFITGVMAVLLATVLQALERRMHDHADEEPPPSPPPSS